jgi:hypothetical protein
MSGNVCMWASVFPGVPRIYFEMRDQHPNVPILVSLKTARSIESAMSGGGPAGGAAHGLPPRRYEGPALDFTTGGMTTVNADVVYDERRMLMVAVEPPAVQASA